MLAAGPATKNTNAVPGDKPLSINAAAIGIEPMAQTYIGIATIKTINIVTIEGSFKSAKNESGRNTVINVLIIKPITNHLPMF